MTETVPIIATMTTPTTAATIPHLAARVRACDEDLTELGASVAVGVGSEDMKEEASSCDCCLELEDRDSLWISFAASRLNVLFSCSV